MPLTVSSTTDSQAEVNLAAGLEAGEGETPQPESTTEGQSPEAATQPKPKPPRTPDEPDEDEDDEDNEDPEDKEEKPKRKGGFQRKIEAQARRIGELEYMLQSQLAGQRRPAGEPPQPQPQQAPIERPVQDQFQSYEEYIEALTDYKMEQREMALAKQAREWHKQEQERQAMNGWQSRVGEFKSHAADFDEVLASTDYIQIPHALQQALIDAENGPQLAYELARQPKELERIAKLQSPLAALRELGKFEAKLSAPVEKPKPAVSKAPEPIKPVGQGATTSTKSPDEMSYQEYKRYRERQIAAQKGRVA